MTAAEQRMWDALAKDDGRTFVQIAASVADEMVAEATAEMLKRVDVLETALRKIAKWHGEFPPTGEKWADGSPVSYGAQWGSNGERDYMREVAEIALKPIASAEGTKP